MLLPQSCIDIGTYLTGDNGDIMGDLQKNMCALLAVLSSMLHTASYIESLVNNSDNMGKISLVISAKCQSITAQDGKRSPDFKVFRIWSPTTASEPSPTKFGPLLPFPTSTKRRARRYLTLGRPTIAIGTPQRINEEDRIPSPYFNISSVLTESPIENLNTKSPNADDYVTGFHSQACSKGSGDKQIAGASQTKAGAWRIPPDIAILCLSQVFDAAGETIHASSLKGWGINELSYAVLQVIIRDMFQVYCGEICDSSEKTSRKDVTYKSFIPKSISPGCVLLPNLRFCISTQNGHEVLEWIKFNPKHFKKPDRNTKVINFTLLCLHLQVFGKEGLAYRIL